jgi:hypothetical protein
MVVPCIVKIWLYSWGVKKLLSGLANWVLIIMAMAPAAKKKTKLVLR